MVWTTQEDRSIERGVAAQHRRLDAMFEELFANLRKVDEPGAIRDDFTRLREALESHVDQEDRIYYPALRALQPAHRMLLDSLVSAHDGFRTWLEGIDAWLGDRDLAETERALGAFARAFAAHEAAEEQLLRRIDAEIHGV